MGIPHVIMAGIVGKFSGKWESNAGVGWFGVALICKRHNLFDLLLSY